MSLLLNTLLAVNRQGDEELKARSRSQKLQSWVPNKLDLDNEGASKITSEQDLRRQRTDQDGRPLYEIRSAKILARSGPYTAECTFTGPGPPLAVRGPYWARAHVAEDLKLDAIYAKYRKGEWVTDVWCISLQEHHAKILIDPPPPVHDQEDLPENHITIVDLDFKLSGGLVDSMLGQIGQTERRHALTKLTPQSADNGINTFRVRKGTYLTAYFPDSLVPVVCRPILSKKDAPGEPYQGRAVQNAMDFVFEKDYEPAASVYAFYCDNWTDHSTYINSIAGTSWGIDWTSAAGL